MAYLDDFLAGLLGTQQHRTLTNNTRNNKMAKNNKPSKHITLATLGVLARCYNCTIKRDGDRYKMYHKSGKYIAGFNAKRMYVYGYAVLDLDRTYSLKRVNQSLFKHFANTCY